MAEHKVKHVDTSLIADHLQTQLSLFKIENNVRLKVDYVNQCSEGYIRRHNSLLRTPCGPDKASPLYKRKSSRFFHFYNEVLILRRRAGAARPVKHFPRNTCSKKTWFSSQRVNALLSNS